MKVPYLGGAESSSVYDIFWPAEVEGATTRTVRFPDNNERRYKTIPLHPSQISGTASDLNWGMQWSARIEVI